MQRYDDYSKGTQEFWYNVFQWSRTKSPDGPADRSAVDFDGWLFSRNTQRPSEVTSRVYLNTTAARTETVAKDLAVSSARPVVDSGNPSAMCVIQRDFLRRLVRPGRPAGGARRGTG